MIIRITENESGMTVKDYLFKVMRFSAASVKRVKYRCGGITVNGETVTVRRVLRKGDILSLATEDTFADENKYVSAVDLPLKIAYEDEYITVVDKDAGMPAHPSLGHKSDTVANALAYRYREAPYVFRPVNRLDRDTSGLMLTARGKISAGRLYKSMVSGEVEKAYIAVLEGKIEEKSEGGGVVRLYMNREDKSIIKRCVCTESEPGAKFSVTRYEVLKTSENFTVVKAYPVTGRTHQLRVHFSHIGHPIYGDDLYGNASPYINRHALHACSLSFPHPENGNRAAFFSPLPQDIKLLIDKLSH